MDEHPTEETQDSIEPAEEPQPPSIGTVAAADQGQAATHTPSPDLPPPAPQAQAAPDLDYDSGEHELSAANVQDIFGDVNSWPTYEQASTTTIRAQKVDKPFTLHTNLGDTRIESGWVAVDHQGVLHGIPMDEFDRTYKPVSHQPDPDNLTRDVLRGRIEGVIKRFVLQRDIQGVHHDDLAELIARELEL